MSPDGGEDRARLDELVQQVANEASMITELAEHVRALETDNIKVKEELAEQKSANRALLGDGDLRKQEKSEIRSVKKLYPEKFDVQKETLKELANEFLK